MENSEDLPNSIGGWLVCFGGKKIGQGFFMGCKLSHTSDALCSDHQRRRVCKILQAPDRQMSSTVSISSYAHDRKTKPIPIKKKVICAMFKASCLAYGHPTTMEFLTKVY